MKRVVSVLILALLIAGCGDEPAPGPGTPLSGTPVVMTTFYPMTYFAERIVGDAATVTCPLPADADPIFYKPPREVVAAYQAADLIVINGAEFEKWVLRTSLPESRIVNTARGFRDSWITFVEATEHSHGPSGTHTHEGLDGHTWLDPVNAKLQTHTLATRLGRLLPDEAEGMWKRAKALHEDLDALDAAWREASKDYAGEAIYTSHPAYAYLGQRYGWTLVDLDLDPETMPDDATIAEIRGRLEAKPARYLWWESAPKPEIAERLETALGLKSVVVSPCEMLSPEAQARGEDYLTVMRRNVEAATPALTPAN